MKKTAKVLLAVLCALLLVVGSVMGTLAWLVSETEVAQNTFTKGHVEIKLDEAKVDEDGVAVSPAERVLTNDFRVLPGHTYTKDPTVTLVRNSDESYVRAIITVSFDPADGATAPLADVDGYFQGSIGEGWSLKDKTVDGNTITYEYRYAGTPNARTADNVLPAVFEEITIPSAYDQAVVDVLDTMQIDVVAHAIQADGFNDADAAWAAFDAQTNP